MTGYQVASVWAGELLDPRTFETAEEAQAIADGLNHDLSIDAVVRPFHPDRPQNWLSPGEAKP